MNPRVRLSTLLILSFLAGGLIWINRLRHVPEPEGRFFMLDMRDHAYAREVTATRGWPFPYEEQIVYVPFDARDIEVGDGFVYADFSKPTPVRLYWSIVLSNAASGIAILAALATLIEWLARRGTVART